MIKIKRFNESNSYSELFKEITTCQEYFDDIRDPQKFVTIIKNVLKEFDTKLVNYVIDTLIYKWYNTSKENLFEEEIDEFITKNKVAREKIEVAFNIALTEINRNI